MKRIMRFLSLFLVAACLLSPGHLLSGEDWYEQGLSLLKAHRYEDAISAFSKAIEMDLHPADAYNNRGFAWQEKGDYERAIADYTKALDINPRYADAYNNLAWALAVCPDSAHRNGAKALELAQKAVELTPEPYALDTLAAAYAEVGKFEKAVAAQRKAIALERKEGKTEALTEYLQRLKSYRAKRPWREDYIAPEGTQKLFPRDLVLKVSVGRVREEPSLDSKIEFRLKKGQTVSAIEREGDWYLVAERTGWAHKSLFSEKGTAVESMRATLKVSVGRVREGPSLDSKIEFRLKKGQSVTILERKGDWCLVGLADGRTGWAHQSLFFKSL